MRRRAPFLAAVAALALVLAPAMAEARPGGGSSSGSRGSRTYSAPPSTNTAPGGAQRFDRTEAPATRPANPGYAPGTQGLPQTARGGMFGGGFMSGLMGGLLGAGLVGMLFGGGAFGGMAGGAGFLGFLLQIALIAGLVWLVLRVLRRNQPRPAMAGMNGAYARQMEGGPRPMNPGMGAGMGGAVAASRPVQVTEADFNAFERALQEVNAAWSRGDMGTLSRLATPEMARYFAGDLRDLAARGWRNETRDVRLESGDLAEAWNEGGQDYATVAMRFSLVDWTTDNTGRVVEGDPRQRQTTTELWTFLRTPGQPWILSAIQQSGR